ncbi:polysaccharide biosynthesis tyrosine autokinase [Propionivibrio sp.]|uniref:GumC family protein n=1 Tax=Propionivibrio sp. TaxID=2212460 RepID=UPI00261CFCBE|nr:polysaccharide biosynthesis tyrosine autokinase [Propionivibrio sp.]
MTQHAQLPHGQNSESSVIALRKDSALSTHLQAPNLSQHDDDAIDLRHYWEIILKRKWTIIFFFLIIVTAVAVGTLLMTPIFRSSITLQIERNDAKVVEIQQVTPNEGLSDSRDFYQTQYELLKSRTLAQRVIDQLNLAESLAFTQKSRSLLDYIGIGAQEETKDTQRRKAGQESPIVGQFLKLLTIEPVRNSRLVKVHFENADAQLATRVVNAVAQAYIALNLERRMDASSYAKTFLQERLEQVKAKLEDSEKNLNKFAREQEIIKGDEKQSSVDSQTLQEFTVALAKVQQERIQSESVYTQMKAAKTQGIPEVLLNPTIQRLKETKAKLEADYQDGLKTYKPGYPKMMQLEAQIAELQAKINEEVDNVRSSITSSYEAAKSKESMISAKLQQAKSSMLGLQDRSIQYNVLKREADTNRQLYEGLLHRYKEVGVAGGIGINNIAIVDKAEIPNHPFKPKLAINLLVAAFLGLFGGIALAFLFEHLDDTVKHGEDLERELHLPLLGLIPYLKNASDISKELAMELVNDPRSAFAESFRSLRTSLQFSTPTGVPKVLMVTSSSMGEGKSTTALSLAIAFAQAGKNVLLIDADLRKASLHKKLGMSNERGLTNLLAGEAQAADVTSTTPVPQLYAMFSGPLPPNPAELLSSAKMATLLSLASEKFDQVIIDGPPVLGLADAPLLGSLAEATVMVCEFAATRRGYAKDAIKRLRATRTHILGGIITKVDAFGRGYGYYQNNYYYYDGSPEAKAQRQSA